MADQASENKESIIVPVAISSGTENFDTGWEFALKDFIVSYGKTGRTETPVDNMNNNGAATVEADTEGWTKISLPHDWAEYLPYAEKGSRNGYRAVGTGFPANSIGWYRKNFTIPAEAEGKRVFLRFDGIFRDSQFWVNGVYLGRNDSGYIGRRFEISDFLNYGTGSNLVTVRVDASKAEGWWYEGAGIYRHTWLEIKDEDGLVPDSVAIRLKELKNDEAVMTVDYETFESGIGHEEFIVKNPHLWSVDDPYLYTYELKGEKFTYGIRTIRFDAEKGLFLNGKHVEVHGVCCHQDHAGVGVAVPDAIQDYRIRKLKEYGVNGYRTSHNAPTPELLDACDRHGILVMDETRFFASSDEGLDQFRRLIVRDRNHPSVIAWSVGNEEHNVQNNVIGKRMAITMKKVANKLDPTRVVTYAGNNGKTHEGVNEVVDVRGVNYIRIVGVENGEFDKYHADHPDTPVWGSEEASTLVTRGADTFAGDTYQQMRDTDLVENRPYGWALGAEEWTTAAAKRPWFAGAFVWTGFDYRGECTWPAINCNFGVLDLCGYFKNNAYYYQARWTDNNVLHIYPHANGPRNSFWVNTNCDEVELFINGESVGKQKRPDGVFRLNFPVSFESGTVEARGIRNGRTVTDKTETTGRFVKIGVSADRTVLSADGTDATVVNFVALDKDGREVPDCCDALYFTEEGAGKILGLGNGNPLDHGSDKKLGGLWTRKFFNGKCQAIIQATDKTGTFTLKVNGETAPSASISIEVR